MKSFSKIKLIPTILIMLIIIATVYIVFSKRESDTDDIGDTSELVDQLTPVINTIEIRDGKTEVIKGSTVELPEGYSFISIVNERKYRNYKCDLDNCLMYIIQGNNREFVISTSEVTNTGITNSLKEQNLNLRGEDIVFRTSSYTTTNDDGTEQSDDIRFEYFTGCISELCYSSDPMPIFDKDINSDLVEEFRNFINNLKIT